MIQLADCGWNITGSQVDGCDALGAERAEFLPGFGILGDGIILSLNQENNCCMIILHNQPGGIWQPHEVVAILADRCIYNRSGNDEQHEQRYKDCVELHEKGLYGIL